MKLETKNKHVVTISYNTPEIKSHVDGKLKCSYLFKKDWKICLLFKQSIKEVNVNRVKKRAQIYTKRSEHSFV